MPHARPRAVLLVVTGAALLAAGLTIALRTSDFAEARIADRPVHLREDGYVSSEACQACHPRQHATWRASYHRTMTQVATPQTVRADFNGVVVPQVPGRPMRLERDRETLWAEFDDPDRLGDAGGPPRIRRQVVLTTGSHNQQIYWYATGNGRLLGQLPAIQLVADGRWIPRRSATMHPPEGSPSPETGSWNGICIACHTTNGRPEIDAPFGSRPVAGQIVQSRVAEFGIACEACHGPGERHVRENRNPLRRYALHLRPGRDDTITQPSRFAAALSSQVCGQCHSVWEFYDLDGERLANSHGLPYRPGDRLADTRLLVQPTVNGASPAVRALLADDARFVSDTFWSDGMVRATGREYNGLLDSPCFKDATDPARTLSCFSCHSMHQEESDPRPRPMWADDELSTKGMNDEACLQCHEPIRRNVNAHTRHAGGSTGSACYNCHLPYTTYGLLKTVRSHQVSSPSIEATRATGRPNACNLCHLDKTLPWTAGYLRQWYGGAVPDFDEDEQTVAASLLTLLKGDAGQRAIIAASMGWGPAQQASGTSWLAPYLALTLDDPYDAVRYISARSMRTLPGFASLDFDFVAPAATRTAMRARALESWQRTNPVAGRRIDRTLLVRDDGTFDTARVDRLRRQRNNRRVFYRE